MHRESLPALLALEDRTWYQGTSLGAPGEAFGEIVFNTGMTGYQEVLTDPSYRGQIVAMTYPEIGVYGVNEEDPESRETQVAGYVVHRAVHRSSNWRATQSLTEYLLQAEIVAMEGVDTRALTRHIRTRGSMRGAISTRHLVPLELVERVRRSPGLAGQDLVGEASSTCGPSASLDGDGDLRVAVVDMGVKASILRLLSDGCASVGLVPYGAPVDEVLSLRPDGVLFSNGPGDPAPLTQTVRLIRGLLENRVPLAGICLGHQLLALAVGGRTYKMQFGHRGINHPVKDLTSGRVLVTAHNHGFAVDPTSLSIAWEPLDAGFLSGTSGELADRTSSFDAPVTMAESLPTRPLVGTSPSGFGPVEITHLSLNDGTVEGLRLQDLPAFSVQFHPESAPGPHDARHFFERFFEMVRSNRAQASGY